MFHSNNNNNNNFKPKRWKLCTLWLVRVLNGAWFIGRLSLFTSSIRTSPYLFVGVIGTAFVSGFGGGLIAGRRWLKLVSFSFSFPPTLLVCAHFHWARSDMCVINLNKEFRRLIAATHKLLSPPPRHSELERRNKTKQNKKTCPVFQRRVQYYLIQQLEAGYLSGAM